MGGWLKEFKLLLLMHLCVEGVLADNEAMNCSSLCSCSERKLIDWINEYNEKYTIGNSTVEENLANQTGKFLNMTTLHNHDIEPQYWYSFLIQFFPYYLSDLNEIQSVVSVACHLKDDKYHFVSDLLNDIYLTRYAAIKITCHGEEDVILDVPMVNVVEIVNCRISSHGKIYQLPADLWILDIQNNKGKLLEHLGASSAKNMFAFGMTNVSTEDMMYMKEWLGSNLLSSKNINLRNNRLTGFRCRFAKDQVTAVMDLRDNLLTSVPACLVQPGAAISELRLSHNHISDISSLTVGFGTYDPNSHLEILDLSNNLIKDFKTLITLPKLHTLDLRNNRIENLGKNKFVKLAALKRLYLQHNLIHRVVDFVGPDSIHLVNLSNNQIETVTIDPVPVTTATIDVRNNNLRLPPMYDCGNTSLPNSGVQVWASGNPFTCSCEARDFLGCMDAITRAGRGVADVIVDVYHLTCSHPREVEGQSYLSLLLQPKCLLDNHCPESCDCQFNLGVITVNCSARNILEMPFNIPLREDATEVKLLLDHNPIQTLGSRSYLPAVTHLALHRCLITKLAPSALTNAAALSHVTLHRNLLSRLPKSIQTTSLPNLKNITLHNNRWDCSCDGLWLAQWMRGLGEKLHQPENVICSNRGSPVSKFNCIGNVVDTAFWTWVITIILGLMTSMGAVYYFRGAINRKCFSTLGLRLWPPITHGGDHCIYDVFLLHSRRMQVGELVQGLEAAGLRLCLLCRDLPSFAAAAHSLPVALHVSRCCVLVVSPDFLQDEWTVPSIRQLLETELRISKRLVLVLANVQGCQLPKSFLDTMHLHPTLTTGEGNFWSRLMYLMPAPRPSAAMSLQEGSCSGDKHQKANRNNDCAARDGRSIYEDCAASDGGSEADPLSNGDQLSDGDHLSHGGRPSEEDLMPISGLNVQNNQGGWGEGWVALDGDIQNDRGMVMMDD